MATATKQQHNIYQRIAAAKQKFEAIKKTKTNPHFKNKYAGLDDIINAIEPALLEQGVVIAGTASRDYITVMLVNIEDPNDYIQAALPLEELNPQKQGSAITYTRRYLLSLMLNLNTEDDDDGNAASLPQNGKVSAPPKQGTGVW